MRLLLNPNLVLTRASSGGVARKEGSAVVSVEKINGAVIPFFIKISVVVMRL